MYEKQDGNYWKPDSASAMVVCKCENNFTYVGMEGVNIIWTHCEQPTLKLFLLTF